MHRFEVAIPMVVAAWAASAPAPVAAQQAGPTIVAHTVELSSGRGRVDFELSDGTHLKLDLNGNEVLIDGQPVARYQPGGELERSWLGLMSQATRMSPALLLRTLRDWKTPGLTGDDAGARTALTKALAAVRAPAIPPGVSAPTIPAQVELEVPSDPSSGLDLKQLLSASNLEANLRQIDRAALDENFKLKNGTVESDDYTLDEDEVAEGDVVVLDGDADIRGHVKGSVVVVRGDLRGHTGATIDGNAVALRGDVKPRGATIVGEILDHALLGNPDPNPDFNLEPDTRVAPTAIGIVGRNVASLVGALVALSCIGFGLVFFMPRELEIVSDTVSQSFPRSFFAGLVATPLIAPALLVLILGLILTVVGIVAIPVAVPAFAIALVLAVLGGYLAAARSVGEFIVRRRADARHQGAGTPYRYLLVGLVAMSVLWIPAVILGWLPLVGNALLWTAVLFTWIVATAGFGAVILSRAGIKGTFIRRFSPELSDDARWTGSHSLTARRAASERHPRV